MGYDMDIVSCSLKNQSMKKLPKNVEESFWELDITDDGTDIVPQEWHFKWDDVFEKELLILAKAGVRGEIETLGQEGEFTKYILKAEAEQNPSKRKKGIAVVEVYDAVKKYPNKPNRTME